MGRLWNLDLEFSKIRNKNRQTFTNQRTKYLQKKFRKLTRKIEKSDELNCFRWSVCEFWRVSFGSQSVFYVCSSHICTYVFTFYLSLLNSLTALLLTIIIGNFPVHSRSFFFARLPHRLFCCKKECQGRIFRKRKNCMFWLSIFSWKRRNQHHRQIIISIITRILCPFLRPIIKSTAQSFRNHKIDIFCNFRITKISSGLVQITIAPNILAFILFLKSISSRAHQEVESCKKNVANLKFA